MVNTTCKDYCFVEGLFIIFSAGVGGRNLNILMLKFSESHMLVISRDIASILFILSMETLVKERRTTLHLGVNVTDVSVY